MSNIKRLTYLFYSYREVKDNKIILKTNFPFIADSELLINRPLRAIDVGSVFFGENSTTNPKLEDLPSLINVSNYGSYNDREWIIGLAINGIVIYDGIFKTPEGISAFTLSGLGQVVIDTSVYRQEFGILDAVEIAVISAQTWSPWMYYGYRYTNDADDDLAYKRSFLLKNIENGSWRKPSNMGGIFSSLIPAQAIQMRHFVNVDLSELFVPFILPYPSAFFTGSYGAASSSNNVYHTADVIDGNGQLKLRSSVKFNISSQSLTAGIGPVQFAIRTVIRADAYRTLNSRKLEYIDKTYTEKKILKSTKFFLCFEKNIKYKNMYIDIARSLSIIVDRFTDKENAPVFIFIGYDKSTYEVIQNETTDLVSAGSSIRSIFEDDSFYTVNPSEEIQITENDFGWKNESFSYIFNYIKNATSLNTNNLSTKSIFFSGMYLSEKDISDSLNKISELQENVGVMGVFLKHISDSIDNNAFEERRKVGENIFGSSYFGLQEGGFYGFQLINILYRASGGLLNSESDLYEISKYEFERNVGDSKQKFTLSGIDSDVLVSQYYNTVLENKNAADRDYDGDGYITLIDRIYSLYNSFDRNNLLTNDRFYGFFSDFGSEMRYWRKVCPHGQNYKITGRIISAKEDIGGNYLLKIIPVWFDPETGDRYEPSDTPIDVYVDNKVRTNVSYISPSNAVLEFQGRLFYPSYVTRLKISPVIYLDDPEELSAWYRLDRFAASRFIEESNGEWKDKPVLFCRSNYSVVDPGIDPADSFIVPKIFNINGNAFETSPPAYLKVSQIVEYVGDHIYNIDSTQEKDITVNINSGPVVFFETTGTISSENLTNETVPITFNEIEFEVEISDNNEEAYKYEMEVLYKPYRSSEFVQIYKFYSAVCFDISTEDPPYVGKIKFSASDPLFYYCRPAPEEIDINLDGRLYNIDIPYREIENFRYKFTFEKEVWEPQLFVNSIRVSALVVDNISSFGNFGSEFSQINPFTGQILFRQKLDTNKNSVSIGFFHKKDLKIGSQLAIRVLSGGGNSIKIKNPSVNLFSTPSLERVEGHFSSTLFGESYHLINPTQGFVSLGGNGWFFQDSAETDDASNFDPGSISVIGSLTSPFLYFDAFSDPSDLVNKTIKMGNNLHDFPIIDIPHTTIAVNTSGAPFTETRTIGYNPPNQEVLSKIDSVYDKNMGKFSIIYNINSALNMKYSFTKFLDIDSEGEVDFDFMNKRLRNSIPIYTGPLELIQSTISNNSINISENDKTAVGILINTRQQNYEKLEDENGVFILEASIGSDFKSFGYENGNGDKFALLIPVYNEANTTNGASGYSQLPYTQGISSLRLSPKAGTKTGTINKVFIQYVDDDKIINGLSGDIDIFKTGDYILFYYSVPSNNTDFKQIMAVMSSKDGQFWKRPGVFDLDSEDSYKPIPILSNYSHPLLLSNDSSDMFFLFSYGDIDNSVNLIHISRSLFMRFSKGSEDGNEKASSEFEKDPIDPKNSRTKMATREEEGSWGEYFGGEASHILPIVFNSTPIFSAAISEQGTLYFVSKSLDNEMRIRINFNEGGTEYSTGGWFDIGVDLLDSNTYLSKALVNETIYSISLSYDYAMQALHLFISTQNKLFLYRIPSALLREKNEEEESNKKINEYLQELVNEIKPILIVGIKENLSEQNIDLNGVALEEEFLPQQVSSNWTEDGQCWVFFLGTNGRSLRCVKSTSDGAVWKLEKNV